MGESVVESTFVSNEAAKEAFEGLIKFWETGVER